jgi:putative SOS response-associated peptidase YedK
MIQPYPAEQMNAYPVSTQVNKPENDHPELVIQVK